MYELSTIPDEWLTEKTSVDEVLSGIESGKLPESLVVSMKKSINSFAQFMMPGDELWRFSSSEESWQNMCGRAGLAIVRNGKVVKALGLMMN